MGRPLIIQSLQVKYGEREKQKVNCWNVKLNKTVRVKAKEQLRHDLILFHIKIDDHELLDIMDTFLSGTDR